MIIEGLLTIVFNLVMILLDLIPDVSFTIPADTVSGLTDFFHIIFYVVPVSTVLAIMSISIMLHSFRLIVSLIKTIWNLLPFV